MSLWNYVLLIGISLAKSADHSRASGDVQAKVV